DEGSTVTPQCHVGIHTRQLLSTKSAGGVIVPGDLRTSWREVGMMHTVVFAQEPLIQAAHHVHRYPGSKFGTAEVFSREQATNNQFTDSEQHPIRSVGAVDGEFIPPNRGWRNQCDCVQVRQ